MPHVIIYSYRFPTNDERRTLWLSSTGHEGENIKNTQGVCTKHFRPQQIHRGPNLTTLAGDAVPILAEPEVSSGI